MTSFAAPDREIGKSFSWERCPVCDRTDSEVYVSFPSVKFARCQACNTVFKSFEALELRPRDFYERAYFHGRKSGRDRRFEHRARKAFRWIQAAMQFVEARSMLDVGCSLGYVIEGGHRLGLDSAGMDISEYAVRVCNERGYRARIGGLDRFPFADGEFDIVIMKHVIEHTPRPKQALAELTRVLSRNGVVLIAVPDRLYWKGQLLRKSYRYFRPDDLGQQHYVYYTDRSLVQLLETSGFYVRASSKAVYRRKEAKGLLRTGYELARCAALTVGCSISRALRLRHELFVIAQRR